MPDKALQQQTLAPSPYGPPTAPVLCLPCPACPVGVLGATERALLLNCGKVDAEILLSKAQPVVTLKTTPTLALLCFFPYLHST